MAVSLASLAMLLAAGSSLLPGADAAVRTAQCGPNNAATTGCNVDVLPGMKVVLDCTDTTTSKVPDDLLTGDVASAKICKGTALRTDATTACTTQENLNAQTFLTSQTASANGWTAEFSEHGEANDVIIDGSCVTTTNGFFFNFVFKATTTPAPGNNSATTAFGLATASSVALLGLVVAAA